MAILNPKHPLAELLKRDPRYRFDAYVFVFDALRFGQDKLDMGRPAGGEAGDESGFGQTEFDAEFSEDGENDDDFDDGEQFDEDGQDERHVTGQDLCEAIRQYALDQYGLLARCVLNSWGVQSTDDFGEIVFNLIEIGEMKKTDSDRREDFNGVYDFAEALGRQAVFSVDRSGKGGGE